MGLYNAALPGITIIPGTLHKVEWKYFANLPSYVGMGKELKRVHCNFARDLLIKAVVIPVTIAETLSKVAPAHACANETCKSISNIASKQCIVKEKPIDNISAAIDLRKDTSDVATTTTANITNDVWITHGNDTLKLSDKVAIEQDEELTDKHMQMAQHLVKIQFLVVGGL